MSHAKTDSKIRSLRRSHEPAASQFALEKSKSLIRSSRSSWRGRTTHKDPDNFPCTSWTTRKLRPVQYGRSIVRFSPPKRLLASKINETFSFFFCECLFSRESFSNNPLPPPTHPVTPAALLVVLLCSLRSGQRLNETETLPRTTFRRLSLLDTVKHRFPSSRVRRWVFRYLVKQGRKKRPCRVLSTSRDFVENDARGWTTWTAWLRHGKCSQCGNTAMRRCRTCCSPALVRFSSQLDETLSRMYHQWYSSTPLDVRERTLSCFVASAPVLPAIDRTPRRQLQQLYMHGRTRAASLNVCARMQRMQPREDGALRAGVGIPSSHAKTDGGFASFAAPIHRSGDISGKRPTEGTRERVSWSRMLFPGLTQSLCSRPFLPRGGSGSASETERYTCAAGPRADACLHGGRLIASQAWAK